MGFSEEPRCTGWVSDYRAGVADSSGKCVDTVRRQTAARTAVHSGTANPLRADNARIHRDCQSLRCGVTLNLHVSKKGGN